MYSHTLMAAALIASLAAPPVVAQTAPDRAAVTSADHNHSGDIIPFTSNGCSGFREARFFSCCYAHDMLYWAGGTRSDRTKADGTLRKCLQDISHDAALAWVTYTLMRLTYVSGWFCCNGWSRAWRHADHDRYAALTPDEQRQVLDEKQRICRSLTLNPATGKYRVDDTREIRATQASQICGTISP